MDKVENARTLPKVYFGLHMVEGVAEYQEPEKAPFRIFIGEETIKNMDPSFKGRPVYVQHVDSVDLKNLQAEADGYVIRSFFNKADGKHWAEFIVVSDAGHEAIQKGWKLSNAYLPKNLSAGGLWHGVEYAQEVKSGEYEHLAIVPNPRYEESVILTPEDFKAYNARKEADLYKLANSKESKSMLTFWKKSKVENASDLETTVVTLPLSKKEISIADLVKNMDASMMPEHMANDDHMVEMPEHGKMSVKALKDAYCNMHAEMKNKAEPDAGGEDKKEPALENKDEAKEPALENKEDAVDEEKEPKLANEEEELEDEKKKKKNAEKELADKAVAAAAKKNATEGVDHFKALQNAPQDALKEKPVYELSEDKVARGKSRYGSN